jgi:chromosome partitioning protein
MAGKIITIAQQKGGSGKTTLAAHLAVAWSRKPGTSVAILDIDPQGSLGEWFEAREERLGEAADTISFRTASGWGSRREARSLARDHDFVVVDTPPKSDREGRPAMEAADLVAIPVQPSPVDLWATEPTIEMAIAEKTPAILILNRVPPRARLTEEMADAMQDFDAKSAKARLGNRVAFAASMGRGSTVLENRLSPRAADEVDALAKELLKLMK